MSSEPRWNRFFSGLQTHDLTALAITIREVSLPWEVAGEDRTVRPRTLLCAL
jgi:hypothetical protein